MVKVIYPATVRLVIRDELSRLVLCLGKGTYRIDDGNDVFVSIMVVDLMICRGDFQA